MIKKHVNKMKMELSYWYKTKLNSKAFAIAILTAIVSIIIKANAVRVGIANALELTFIL